MRCVCLLQTLKNFFSFLLIAGFLYIYRDRIGGNEQRQKGEETIINEKERERTRRSWTH